MEIFSKIIFSIDLSHYFPNIYSIIKIILPIQNGENNFVIILKFHSNFKIIFKKIIGFTISIVVCHVFDLSIIALNFLISTTVTLHYL
jgi:hypothetical protein